MYDPDFKGRSRAPYIVGRHRVLALRIKRSPVYLLIPIIIILLLYHSTCVFPSSHRTSRLGLRQSCPVTPPTTPYRRKRSERFDWREVSTKYPVKTLAKLPTKRLRHPHRIQHLFPVPTHDEFTKRDARQQAVKAVFQRSWTSYRQRAWLHDELGPISGLGKKTFGGWGATLVDALDTLLIMDMHDEFEEAVAAAVNIDFSPDAQTTEIINIFETTIRYLGGFLAAYDLTGCRDERLLDKAVEIGDMIYKSFDTPNRMPVTRWSPRKAVAGEEQSASENAIVAELGSSTMEMTRLSQLTGDMRYFDAVQRITDLFDDQQNKTKLPGMWPIAISVANQDLTVGSDFSLGAMSDSAYEYLGKMYALLNSEGEAAEQYDRIYNGAMDTILNHILFKPMLPDSKDVLISGGYHAATSKEDSGAEHLSCYVGGMLALGGKLFNNAAHLEAGRKVTNGCVWMYKNSPLGIMPERVHMLPCPNARCDWEQDTWVKKRQRENTPRGIVSVDDAQYHLRPEAIESVFYMYRITGDPAYQETAWEMFQAIEKHTATKLANAAIRDVTIDPPELQDNMESFWLAETLKYFYLIFSDPELISLDDFVLNTEAHPFRRPRG